VQRQIYETGFKARFMKQGVRPNLWNRV